MRIAWRISAMLLVRHTMVNETHYSSCRESLLVGLSTPTDTATAAAGDRVEGVLLRDARSKTGIVAKADDQVEGRILG